MTENLCFFNPYKKTYSFRLEVDQKTFEKVQDALKPLGFSFRAPRR